MATRRRQQDQAAPTTSPKPMIPADQLRTEIAERLERGQELLTRPIRAGTGLRACRDDYYTWSEYNEALVRRSFDLASPANEYRSVVSALFDRSLKDPSYVRDPLYGQVEELRGEIASKMRWLRSIQKRLRLFSMHPDAVAPAAAPDRSVIGEDVFIVHGHDDRIKQTVARFITQLVGREPVILHEQPDRGRTIIEKFEAHAARASCAIVLLTGDDVGGQKHGGTQPRARQNVVLELGFFLGKLGRARVVILHGTDVELPSDLRGVLYVPLDGPGAWRNAVARELEAAGVEVDLRVLLN